MKQKLIGAAYQVIKEEGLPKAKIIYRQPLDGTRKQFGTCIRNHILDTYRILIYTTKAKFVEAPNGNFTCKKTFKKLRRVMGEERSFDEISDTMAHEIAHLKEWRHGKKHRDYTKKILMRIINIIGEQNEIGMENKNIC